MKTNNEITLNKKSEIDMELFIKSSDIKNKETNISLKGAKTIANKTNTDSTVNKKIKEKKIRVQDQQIIKQESFTNIKSLRNAINNSQNLPPQLKLNIEMYIERLDKLQKSDSFIKEFDLISNYVSWILKYPWDNYADENLDINEVRKLLNDSHYGLDKVKERFLQLVAVRKLLLEENNIQTAKKSSVICMVGLQGIGKTTLAKSIAKALNRPFYRISVGAIGSSLEIRGRNKSVEGSEPGQIYKAFINTGVRNPVILLDELDKASGEQNLRTDIMAAMLEILDPEQNTSFRDHYIDYPINLSDAMFIISANKTSTFSAALLDRLEIIKMPAYTDDEKKVIARDYLLPRVRKSTGLAKDQLEFKEDVWQVILRPLGYDSGIRSLHRIIESIAQATALKIVEGETEKVVITATNFHDYLKRY